MSYVLPVPFIIAIDGPAASGKGTIARKLAAYFDLPHLDTGLMYRAVARALLDNGDSLDDEARAIEALASLDLDSLNPDILRARGMGESAARVAVLGGLRDAMRDRQRSLAQRPPGIVMDGRDIASNVCPDANIKLFITATADIRARRRYDEMVSRGFDVELSSILSDIEHRDEKDRNRAIAPLLETSDSHLCDTSNLSIDGSFEFALEIVLSCLRS